MSATKIEWADRVWNPVVGCTRVSEGCRNCYAEQLAGRLARMPRTADLYGPVVQQRDGKSRWTGKIAVNSNRQWEPRFIKRPARWFVNSMSDLGHAEIPLHVLAEIWATMIRAHRTHGHVFMVLTKRPGVLLARLTDSAFWDAVRVPDDFRSDLIASRGIWVGVSAEDQVSWDERVPMLKPIPAAGRFVSVEPMLGPIDPLLRGAPFIDWIIVGGESGPRRRPFDERWALHILAECRGAGIPFFFKQHGFKRDPRDRLLGGCVYQELPVGLAPRGRS